MLIFRDENSGNGPFPRNYFGEMGSVMAFLGYVEEHSSSIYVFAMSIPGPDGV